MSETGTQAPKVHRTFPFRKNIVAATSRLIRRGRGRNLFGMLVANEGYLLTRQNPDHVIVFPSDDYIGRAIMRSGEYSRDALRKVFDVLRTHGLGPGGTFLEIGANIGTHSVYASLEHNFDRLVCLEPEPRNFSVLQKNIAINNLQKKASCVRMAASDAAGQLSFYTDPTNMGASKIVPSGGNCTVEADTVDRILERENVDPSSIRLIWMDVEGHEYDALRGMTGLLRTHRPPLFMEVTPNYLGGEQLAKLAEMLFEAYNVVMIHEDAEEPGPSVSAVRHIALEDLKAVRKRIDVFAYQDTANTS